MSRALALLIRFRHVGGWRNCVRRGQGSVIAIIGKVLILAYLLMLILGWIGGVWFALTTPPNDPIRTAFRSGVDQYGSLAPIPFFFLLTFIGAFAIFEPPFRFNPAEVDFLQAGPFRRRQLLAYKFGAEFTNFVVIALLAAPPAMVIIPFASGFLGTLLFLTFILLFQHVVSALGTSLGMGRSKGPVRAVISLSILAASCALIGLSFGRLITDPAALSRQATQMPGWRIALAPLRVLFDVILTQRVWPDLVRPVSLCLLINGALLAVVCALDARLERREDEDDRTAADLDSTMPVSAPQRWALPLWSVGQGAGAVAWRQAMNLARGPQHIGFALIIYGSLLFACYAIIRYCRELLFLPTLDGHLEVNPAGIAICGGLAVLLPMLISAGISFDFRSDMGRMDVLKALPMRPMAIVAGQLCVPIMMASVMQWALVAVIAIALGRIPAGLWVAALFAPPVSIVLMAIENLPTFWFPLRQAPGCKPEPYELFGHALLHPLIRAVGYALTSGTMAVVAALAFFLFGNGIVAAIIAAWLTLVVSGVGLIVLLAHTFDRFDVAQDTTA